MNESAAKTLKPVQVSRTFHASRQRVFTAWSSAEAVKRWFAPTGFTVPEAKVELAVGGPFEVLMRSPTGEEHWARGVVREVSAFERLVIDFTIEEPNGRALFRALTEVNFSDTLGGTRLDATQSYTVIDPDAAWMPEGAPQGWAQTLDNLAEEVLRIEAKRSVSHGVFSVERAYDAPVERVWRALSDREAKAKWFGGTVGEWSEIERSMDFRVGGAERLEGPLDKRRRLRLRRGLPRHRSRSAHRLQLHDAPQRGEDLRLARHHGARSRESRPHAPESDGTGRLFGRLRRRRLARARHGVPARQARAVARKRSLSDQRARPDRTIVPSPDIGP